MKVIMIHKGCGGQIIENPPLIQHMKKQHPKNESIQLIFGFCWMCKKFIRDDVCELVAYNETK